MKEKRTNVRWMFALAFFFIGVIAYMDRANISYIAKQMMDDLGMTKPQFWLIGIILLSRLCINASTIGDVG